MKHIGKLAVLGAILAASASFAFADTLGSYASGSAMGNINTPLNYAGYTVGNYTGSLSDFVQNPSAYIQSGTAPAFNIGAGSPWANAQPNSSWVSYTLGTNPASGPAVIAPQGYYTFNTKFGESATGSYDISLNLLADDTLAVYLNGVNVLLSGPLGTDSKCSDFGVNCEFISNDKFSASLTGGVNNNTLTFVVEQTGFADFGLNFTGTVAPSTTPEPSSLMLLGSGLLGAAGMFFRRRAVA